MTARVPLREFNLPMIWATAECLLVLESELTMELARLPIEEALFDLASKRNGLTAVHHELNLRELI